MTLRKLPLDSCKYLQMDGLCDNEGGMCEGWAIYNNSQKNRRDVEKFCRLPKEKRLMGRREG